MTKRITRSRTDEKAQGNLVKIAEPAFVSLVNMPANQRPFPVIRSGKKVKRGDNAVLMLTFPEDFTEDDVNEILDTFSMSDYSVVAEGGAFVAIRSDLQSVANLPKDAAVIRMTKDGVTAHIDPKQYQPKEVKRGIGVAVTGYTFDKKTFDNEKIISWLHENGVDISNDDIENSHSDVFSVSRMQVAEGSEVRQMELESGVIASVVRDDSADNVPANYVAVVNEAAYGQWGWGQLDFSAMVADVAFCELMEDATYRLRNVLDNIMFYSQLTLDVRKQLVTRCLQQYEAFVHDLIDQLPRQVLLLASRADSIKRKESDMAIDVEQAKKDLAEIEAKRAADEKAKVEAEAAAKATAEEEAKRAADEKSAAEAAAAAAATEASGTDTITMTRSEFNTAIADGVKAFMAAEAQRAADEKAAADKAEAEKAAAVEAQRSAASSDEKLAATIASAVAAAVAPLNEKVERMANTAVVRSAEGEDGKKKTEVKRSAFAGVFGVLGGKAE